MNSKDFYIYICTNGFDIHTENEYDVTGNTKEIENSAKCKKMNFEYCNDTSECERNYSINGYCLDKNFYDDAHRYDESDRKLNIIVYIILIIIIIIILIIIILITICIIKKSFSNKKKIYKK